MRVSFVTGALAVVAVLVVSIAVILVIGASLPTHHNVSKSIHVAKPVNEVYAAVRDFAAAPSWRSDLKTVDMLGDVGGRLRFREDGSNGAVTYELMEDVPNVRIVTRIVDTNLGYSGGWTYAFDSSTGGPGTDVTITEDADVTNVFFRFMSRFVFGHSATIAKYLQDLEARMR